MAGIDQVDSRTIVAMIRGLITEPSNSDQAANILEMVADGFGRNGAIMWEPRPDSLQPSCVWVRGVEFQPTLDDAPSRLAEETWRSARPVWSVELAQPDQDPKHDSVIEGLIPELAFPVTIGDRPAAVIELHGTSPVDPDPAQTELARVLGPLLGDWQERISFEHDQATLASRLRFAEERQRLLADTSRVLSDSIDEGVIVQGLADELVPALADACAVHLVNSDHSIKRTATAVIPAITQRLADDDIDRGDVSLTDETGVGASIRTGMGMLYSKITDALLTGTAKSPEHLELLRSINPASGMIAPVVGHGGTFGALTVLTADSGRIYTDEDLTFLEDIGRRTGVAIAGARALRRERSLGIKLQAGLLPPRLPRAEWLDLAGRYQPARTDSLVGGDFYDCFQISNDRLMFAIGDVCGHGPEAATLTARIRYAAKALARHLDSPASILESVNQMMIEDGSGQSQFTAVYGVIEPTSTGVGVSLVRAGHPPPLLVRQSGEITEVLGQGTLLGFYPDVVLTEEIIELERDDILFLHTDGLTDARNESEMFGEQRLRTALASSTPSRTVGGLVESIMGMVAEFAPEPSDDIAVLAISPRIGAG